MFGAKHAQLANNFSLIESRDRFKRQVFIRRVHEFLRLYSGKKVDTLKVSFHLDGEHAADLDEWIRFAIEKGAQVLDLELFNPFLGRGYPHHDYDFPHQLLQLSNPSSLKHLSLRRCVLKSLPYQFNQLTTLELREVILDENFIACLFSNCLLLERLTLSNCKVGRQSLIITDHPRLTDLKVLYNLYSWGCGAKLEIYAANLVSLEHAGYDISCIKAPRLARLYLSDGFEGLAHFASCPRLESLYMLMQSGIKTDVVICCYDDHFLVIATQIGAMGTILQASKEEGATFNPTYSVSVIFGKRNEPMLEACARQLVEHISNSRSSRPLMLSLGLKDHSAETLKGIVAAVIENRLW
ncbi:hypothetical protein ACLB2K_061598 [Fragaria x ananassa]